jgi:hypothetical protein
MIEAFERHLQASTFARKAEKATTVEEQIKFCQEFLDKNRKALPPINLGGEHYSITNDVDSYVGEFRDDRNKKSLTVRYSVNEYEMMRMSERERQDVIGGRLREGLMNSILTSGAIQMGSYKDHSILHTVYTAKIGVYIP